MPPHGSRAEEAPSRISREQLPGSIRERRVTRSAANTQRLTGRPDSPAISHLPGSSHRRFPQHTPPAWYCGRPPP